MSFLPSALIAGSLALLSFSESSLALPEITLPSEDGKSQYKALVFPLTEKMSVSIGVVGADVTKSHANDEAPKVLAHDPESRLLLLDLPAADDAILPELGEARTLLPGDPLYTQPEMEGKIGRVVAWVSLFDKEYLPFAFLRVVFDDEVAKVGQPLYNAQGKLVAVAHQATPETNSGTGTSCYAVPVEALQRVLGDFDRGLPVRRCWVGCHLDTPNTFPKIVGIRPDSPASKAGMMKEDVLLQIGPRQLRNYDDVVNAFYYLLADKEVVFRVLRGTEIVDLKVTPVADPRYSLIKP